MKSSKQILVILGSARGDGDTYKLVSRALENIPHELINLLDWNIEPYNYSEVYSPKDQFFELAQKMEKADLIIFATPVYWYSMSAQLKIFFDRMTNLTDIYKSIGKGLKGKGMALVAVGANEDLPEGFLVPFSETAQYFDMVFKGHVYQDSRAVDFPQRDLTFTRILDSFH